MILPNMVNMGIRNTRYRYPVSSECKSDTMDEIYYTLTELLGYQDEAGGIAVSGVLREQLASIELEVASELGASASGVQEAYTHTSGVIGSEWNSIYDINYAINSMINNPIG